MKKLLLIILCLLVAIFFVCCNTRDLSTDKESNADNDIENAINNDGSSKDNKDASGDSNIKASEDSDMVASSTTDDIKKEEKMDSFILKGKVKALHTHLEIEVIESDYAFGIYWVIVPKDTPVLDKNGNNIELSSLKVDDIVTIAYNGQTMMSYPPQIVALKTEKSDT